MKIHDILLDIRARHGVLTPEIVREEARPEDSPIHAFVFNVDADEAAEEYYLARSHRLIQIARVTIRETPKSEPRRIRAFLAVPSEQNRFEYEPTAEVVADPEKFARVRLEAARRLRDAESSLEDLDALAAGLPVQATTKEAVSDVRKARKRLAEVAD
jgi:hypothetical protein